MASKTDTRDLVPVHGGLAEPVDRSVSLRDRKEFLTGVEGLPRAQVRRADLSTVYRFGDGALSPLEGPMGEVAWRRVLDEAVVIADGKPYAWGIPLSLPVTDAEAEALSPGGSVALENEAGEIVAVVEGLEVFEWDKAAYVKGVYGTERTDHPGGAQATDDERTKLLGGSIRTLPQRFPEAYSQYMLSPRMTRAFIRDRKWERALAFQTRNPLHRAHEYALVAGAERVTGEGHFTGVVLNPLVGELKGDDVPAATRMRCYETLHDLELLGEGDLDESLWAKAGWGLAEVFELLGLDIKMFYGGPREAIMHAVYRQNYGFSDLVIGRKHADAPYFDGSPIWGDFDAQEIFDNLAGELHIQPCKIGFAAFYESLGRVDLTENHADEKPYGISGTKVREQLKGGERPDARIMRPEVADILIDAYKD
ncbi:MAG: sulfate adenylyltransferase [Deltaproteobacteria bacterium]|nr:sulfate adenylyltransferase [Deltaproteobacteria bacterium]